MNISSHQLQVGLGAAFLMLLWAAASPAAAQNVIRQSAAGSERADSASTSVPARSLTYRTTAETPTVAEPVRWGRRAYARPYYGRPYGAYYAPGPRYYSGYRGNYGPSPWGARYYGTPRYGYYDYPYGGGARAGGMRFYWR
jgi:hypothetical protein